MTDWKSWFKQQSNDRTLLGLKVLGCLLLFWIYLQVQDQAQMASGRAQAAQSQALSLRGLDDGTLWASRAKQARGALADWQKGQWVAPTPGIAAAMVQGELEALVNGLGAQASNIKVSPDVLTVDGQSGLRFDLTARGDQATIVMVLVSMALHQPRLIPGDVNANFSKRRSNVRLSGFAPFQAQSAQDQPAATAASSALAAPKKAAFNGVAERQAYAG
ncbi:hypothetical protein GCM10007972_10990 [Iodidimonas muriae]|uniref:General secretion pathway protein GspM n=1 Tax=Iodidimonas muriae TaxID=261467 RepID=A0ABQ2LBH9_9PROT|nr:hypothetical protein [Iodidimonas muriae]GER06921.1 hypothetical protein JCM17843_12310 [Kordiimonadales bacterium JCM 17843]GGO09454.1 hypothetical protein GCM10007972_10990 [Iodidimonas muriae]